MSIDPSDRSEEARPSMTINRHQTRNNTREKAAKVPLHFAQNPRPHGINTQMLPLREQTQTLTQGTHDTPRNEQEHIPHTGEFHPSLHPFLLSLSSLQPINRGFCTQIEVQIQKHTSTEKSPSFSFTSQPH